MRTLKKTLCFVLAVVMILGLGAFSVSAKTTEDYSDAAEIKNTEAVDVLGAIKVLDGYDTGDFQPEGTLTRAEAAKIITTMLGITNLNAKAQFEDVPNDFWASSAIAYCANEGIVAGINPEHTIFDPNGQLTAEAFAKMLLTAIGYDAKIEGMVDDPSWEINIAKLVRSAGLNKGLENVDLTNVPITRDNAAQMALNALRTPLMEYESTTTVSVNGAEVSIGNANAKPVTKVDSTGRYEQISKIKDNTNREANLVEFAEEYQPKLTLADDFDDFGRPARTWAYEKKDIGTYVKNELKVATYTTAQSGKTFYDALGRNAVETYAHSIYVDGIIDETETHFTSISRRNNDDQANTGRGVLTEVFVDNTDESWVITHIHTYLALATADYNEKSESVTLNAYHVQRSTISGNTEYVSVAGAEASLKAEAEDFPVIKDAKEDDPYLVTIANGKLQTVEDAEVLAESTVKSFSQNDNTTKVIIDDKTYNNANTAQYDEEVLNSWTGTDGVENLKNSTYDVYLDKYENMIGVALHEGVTNYAFVAGIENITAGTLANKTTNASLLFLDGSTATVKVDPVKSSGTNLLAAINGANIDGGTDYREINNRRQFNKWVTYTVAKDGTYTLREVAGAIDVDEGVKRAQGADNLAAEGIEIDSKHVSLSGGANDAGYARVYGNNDSVYLTAKLGFIITNSNTGTTTLVINGTKSVNTGIESTSLITYKTALAEKVSISNYPSGGAFTVNADNVEDKVTRLDPVVYTLYNEKGYVIAAVVVGEDTSATKNLVYVRDRVNQEDYDNATEEWTWTRDVIYNGENVSLKEKGTALTHLNTMTNGSWYEVGFDKDGYVISVIPLAGNKTADTDPTAYVTDWETTGTTGDPAGRDTIGGIVGSRAVNTLVYDKEEEDTVPTLKGQTLYLDTSLSNGFRVASDVKIALSQITNNKRAWNYYSGVSQLTGVLDTLNKDENGEYNFNFDAQIVNGAATAIIIYDNTGDGNAPTGGSTSGIIDVILPIDYLDGDQDEIQVFYTGDTRPNNDQIIDAVIEKLASKGLAPVDTGTGNLVVGGGMGAPVVSPVTGVVVDSTEHVITFTIGRKNSTYTTVSYTWYAPDQTLITTVGKASEGITSKSGTITDTTGTLVVAYGANAVVTGDVTITGDAWIDGYVTVKNGGSLTITGAAVITENGHVVNERGAAIAADGNVYVGGNSLVLNAGSTATLGNLFVFGKVEVAAPSGAAAAADPTLTVTGTTAVFSDATMVLNGTAAFGDNVLIAGSVTIGAKADLNGSEEQMGLTSALVLSDEALQDLASADAAAEPLDRSAAPTGTASVAKNDNVDSTKIEDPTGTGVTDAAIKTVTKAVNWDGETEKVNVTMVYGDFGLKADFDAEGTFVIAQNVEGVAPADGEAKLEVTVATACPDMAPEDAEKTPATKGSVTVTVSYKVGEDVKGQAKYVINITKVAASAEEGEQDNTEVTQKPDAPTFTKAELDTEGTTLTLTSGSNLAAGTYKLYVGDESKATKAVDGSESKTVAFTVSSEIVTAETKNATVTVTVDGQESEKSAALKITAAG